MSDNKGFSAGGGFNAGGGFSTGGGFKMGGSTPDPLAEVEYTDGEDFAEDCARENTALQKGFESRAKREKERFRRSTDSEFWFAVYFESREEKESFLKAAGVLTQMMGDKYIDGADLAKVLGIEY